jgi:hypothetical protein
MTLQHGESRLDRVEVVLVPGVEVMAQARRFVRRFMESSGAQSETTERMVQLVAELLGRGPSRSPRPWKRSPPRCVSPSSSGHLLTTPLCSGGGRSIHWAPARGGSTSRACQTTGRNGPILAESSSRSISATGSLPPRRQAPTWWIGPCDARQLHRPRSCGLPDIAPATVHLAYGPLTSGVQRTVCGLPGELKEAHVSAAAVSCSHCRVWLSRAEHRGRARRAKLIADVTVGKIGSARSARVHLSSRLRAGVGPASTSVEPPARASSRATCNARASRVSRTPTPSTSSTMTTVGGPTTARTA